MALVLGSGWLLTEGMFGWPPVTIVTPVEEVVALGVPLNDDPVPAGEFTPFEAGPGVVELAATPVVWVGCAVEADGGAEDDVSLGDAVGDAGAVVSAPDVVDAVDAVDAADESAAVLEPSARAVEVWKKHSPRDSTTRTIERSSHRARVQACSTDSSAPE